LPGPERICRGVSLGEAVLIFFRGCFETGGISCILKSMSEHPAGHLGGGLAYEDRLPLKWSLIKEGASLATLAHIHDVNERFLRRAGSLEDEPADFAETHPELAKELMRLESKLDMIFDMVSTVVAGHLKLPKPCPIRLTATEVSWESPHPPPAGARVHIALYLLPNYPYPLTLQGRVESVEACSEGRRATAVFDEMSETAQDWLEKTIFRQHRRRVALSRRAQQD